MLLIKVFMFSDRFHGGTNFGFMGGAIHAIDRESGQEVFIITVNIINFIEILILIKVFPGSWPVVTSYDYNAPITEFGGYTEKCQLEFSCSHQHFIRFGNIFVCYQNSWSQLTKVLDSPEADIFLRPTIPSAHSSWATSCFLSQGKRFSQQQSRNISNICGNQAHTTSGSRKNNALKALSFEGSTSGCSRWDTQLQFSS